jgi:nucleotide-binding universal stress UspA family protein
LSLLHVAADPDACPYPDAVLRLCVSRMPPALVAAVRPRTEIRYGDAIVEILRAERTRDLVVLVAHRKSILGDWALGTTVERVLRRSRVPVLAIPSS